MTKPHLKRGPCNGRIMWICYLHRGSNIFVAADTWRAAYDKFYKVVIAEK